MNQSNLIIILTLILTLLNPNLWIYHHLIYFNNFNNQRNLLNFYRHHYQSLTYLIHPSQITISHFRDDKITLITLIINQLFH